MYGQKSEKASTKGLTYLIFVRTIFETVPLPDLERYGHELRRPTADLLRDGIWELRAKQGRVHYRILYFYCGKDVACLSHGFPKEGKVPEGQIDLAIQRKEFVEINRGRYTAVWEVAHG